MRFIVSLLVTALIGSNVLAADLPTSPAQVTPVLISSALPDAALRTIDGNPTTLAQAVGGKPAVLVFYRGGWCPYCNLQLSDMRLVEKDLKALGFEIIAISPDRPEELRKTLDKDALNYTLLSDSAASAMRAFGIAYRVDDTTNSKLNGFGVDLEKSSGESHRALPVPAVYVVDSAGVLQFSYVNPDYRVRIPSRVVLAAAKAIAAQQHKQQPK